MTTRRLRSWVIVAVVVLALALAVGPALAVAGPQWDLAKGGNGHGKAKGGAPWFTDVSGDDWAWPDIETMAAKGVMQGYGKGLFGPKNHVSRLELVVLATRLLGFEDEAQALTPEAVAALLGATFADYRAIPAWPGARECLAYALEQGYLWPLMQGGGGPTFRPNAPAKRVEVIVVLLEAAGLGHQADERIGAALPFKDASAVPAWAWGYVALGVELGIVRGTGGTLRPNQPVARAEIAALLSRLDDYIDTDLDRDIVTGEVVEVHISTNPAVSSTITVIPDSGRSEDDEDDEDDEDEENEEDEQTYSLAPGVVVILDDQQSTLAAVTAGLRVTLYLNEDGKVLLIDGDTRAGHGTTKVTGMVLTLTLGTAGKLTSITLWHDNEAETFTAAATVVITKDGHEVAANQITAGQTVDLTLTGGKITAVVIGQSPSQTTKVTGMVLTLTLGAAGKLTSITLWHDSKTETFAAAATVVITKDGHAVAANQITAGQTVELTLTGGKITAVEIDPEDQTSAVEGTVTRVVLRTGLNPDPAGAISIIPEGGGVPDEETYEVARAATVTVNGQAAHLGDVRPGDSVILTLDTQDHVTAIVATYTVSEITGTVLGSVVDASGKLMTLTVRSGGQDTTRAAGPEAKVYYHGAEVAASEITAGDTVTLTVARGMIIRVTILVQAS